MKTALGIFAKFPRPGQVKTRLAKALGAEGACQLYSAFLQDLIDRLRPLPLEKVLYFTPDDHESRAYFQALTGGEFELLPQPEGDLGVRQHHFFAWAAERHFEAGLVIGSDSPDIPIAFLVQARDLLSNHKLVLGPSLDGGYYLLGQHLPAFDCFQQIAWSSTAVFGELLDRLSHWPPGQLALLPPWYDVDEIADLAFFAAHLRAARLAGNFEDLTKSAQVLRMLGYNPG